MNKPAFILFVGLIGSAIFTSSGCGDTEAKQPAPQPLPVKTETINLAPVPRLDEYVATVKSRRWLNGKQRYSPEYRLSIT